MYMYICIYKYIYIYVCMYEITGLTNEKHKIMSDIFQQWPGYLFKFFSPSYVTSFLIWLLANHARKNAMKKAVREYSGFLVKGLRPEIEMG